MKRGLASPCVHSALPITRRRRLQLFRVSREVLEAPRRLAGSLAARVSAACQFGARSRRLSRSFWARPNTKSTPLRLAPGHQLLAGKARIGAQQDARRGQRARIWPTMRATSSTAPALASMFGAPQLAPPADAGRRRRRAADSSSCRNSRGRSGPPGGRAADRRWHPGRERSAAARADAPPGTDRPTALDRRRVVADLVIARRPAGGSAPAGSACSCRPAAHSSTAALQLAGQHRQQRIMAQMVVVVQVLVAQRQREDPLADQRADRVLDQLRRPRCIREAAAQTGRPARSPDPSRPAAGAGIRRDRPAVERRHTRRPRRVQTRTNPRIHSVGIGGLPLVSRKSLRHNAFLQNRRPRCTSILWSISGLASSTPFFVLTKSSPRLCRQATEFERIG